MDVYQGDDWRSLFAAFSTNQTTRISTTRETKTSLAGTNKLKIHLKDYVRRKLHSMQLNIYKADIKVAVFVSSLLSKCHYFRFKANLCCISKTYGVKLKLIFTTDLQK